MAGSGMEVFAYTAQFGNGLSASISAENANGRRTNILSTPNGVANNTAPWNTTTSQYGNQQVPDIVGNLRIDQAWGSAQIMGAYHQLTANSLNASDGAEMTGSGWAFGAGLKLNAPMLGKSDYAIAQFTVAEGATSYVGSGINGGFTLTSGNTVSGAVGSNNYFGQEDDATIVNNGLDN